MPDKILVTSVLTHENGRLHIGHIAKSLLPADIYVRYQRLRKRDIAFIGATDDYGGTDVPTQDNEGMQPQEVAARARKILQESFERLGISFDHFSATSRPLHHKTAQDFFLQLHTQGYIEKQELPLSPQWILRLDKLRDRLSSCMDSRAAWKDSIERIFEERFATGSHALVITRDGDWGIPVPLRESRGRVLDARFEAPLAYLSAAQEWAEKIGEPGKCEEFRRDPESRLVIFLGKEQIFDHAIAWAGQFLSNHDYLLPTGVLAADDLHLENEPIEPCRNHVVWLHEALEDFPPDYLRYYLTAISSETAGYAFAWEDFAKRVNGEFAAYFGTVAARVFAFINSFYHGIIPSPKNIEAEDRAILLQLDIAKQQIAEALESYAFAHAQAKWIDCARVSCQYLQKSAPWQLHDTAPDACSTVMHLSCVLVKNLAILGAPFVPFIAQRAWELLGFTGRVCDQSWNDIGCLPFKVGRLPFKEGQAVAAKCPTLVGKVGDREIRKQMARLGMPVSPCKKRKEPFPQEEPAAPPRQNRPLLHKENATTGHPPRGQIAALIPEIRIIEVTDLHEWDHYLRQFSASPLLAAPWIEAFRTSQRVPIYFRFVADTQTIGIIAGLVIQPSHAFLRRIDRSLFFYSGPAVIQFDRNLINACIGNLLDYARANGFTSVSVQAYDYPYAFDACDLPYEQIQDEYVLDLRGDFTDIQDKMRTSLKKNIRRAEKAGLTFHESCSPDIIETLIRLLEETKSVRRSKGYEDYSYFYMPHFDKEVIYKLFQQRIARIFYAQQQGKSVYLALSVTYNRKAYGLIAGTSMEGYKLNAPAFTLFYTIKKLHEEGIGSLNLSGVAGDSGESGLIFFKTSFGAQRHQCIGRTTSYLKNPFFNMLYQIHAKKLSIKTMKKFWDFSRKR